MTIGKRIQEARKKVGYTQKQLAFECGLKPGTIQQYELDKRNPSFERLFLIAEKLHVSITDLIDEKEFNKKATEATIKSLENTTVEYTKKLFSLEGYTLKRIDDNHFKLYADYDFFDIKEISLELDDLSDVEIWANSFMEKVIKHIYNQKNNPNYNPDYKDLPYYVDAKTIEENKLHLEQIKKEFEELHKKALPQIPSPYEMQRLSDMSKIKKEED